MSTITIRRELPAQFLSDILVTAFDGGYGWSWNWFEPAKQNWLQTEAVGENRDEIDLLWMCVNVRLTDECETGIASIDALSKGKAGFLVDHDTIAKGIQRILDDDYVGTWREATPTEKIRLLGPDRHLYADREWKWDGLTLLVETGETARGYREELAKIISGLETGATDAGDIDAPFADAIVQVGLFGKAIFS